MQKVQFLLHPSMIVTIPLYSPWRETASMSYGRASGKPVATTRSPARRRATTSCSSPTRAGPRTKSRSGTRARAFSPSCCATQPQRPIRRSGRPFLNSRYSPSREYTFCSAFSRTLQELSRMTSASAGLAGGQNALLHELAGHALAVQLVHLAAPGLDEEAARTSHFQPSRGSFRESSARAVGRRPAAAPPRGARWTAGERRPLSSSEALPAPRPPLPGASPG